MKMLSGLRSSLLVGLSTLAVSVSASAADLLIEAYGDSTTLGISCVDHQCGPRPENAAGIYDDGGAYIWMALISGDSPSMFTP